MEINKFNNAQRVECIWYSWLRYGPWLRSSPNSDIFIQKLIFIFFCLYQNKVLFLLSVFRFRATFEDMAHHKVYSVHELDFWNYYVSKEKVVTLENGRGHTIIKYFIKILNKNLSTLYRYRFRFKIIIIKKSIFDTSNDRDLRKVERFRRISCDIAKAF